MSFSATFRTKNPSLLLRKLNIFGVTKENQEPIYRRGTERDERFSSPSEHSVGARPSSGFPSRS